MSPDILMIASNRSISGLFRNHGAHRIATEFRFAGLDVEVIDFFEMWPNDDFSKLVQSRVGENTKAIMWSVTFQVFADVGLTNRILSLKKEYPNIKQIVGSSKLVSCSLYPMADLIVSGYAELAVPDIIKFISTGKFPEKTTRYKDIPLLSCTEHYYQHTLPNLLTVHEDRDYIEPTECLTLETARGCIFRCSFCNFPYLGKKKGQYVRPIEKIQQQIELNRQRFGTNNYIISDETFNDDPDKVQLISDTLIQNKYNLQLQAYVRADLMAVHQNHRQLVDMGLTSWFCGIESFNRESARFAGKGTYSDKILPHLIEWKQEYSTTLDITGSFIVGLPFDTIGQITESHFHAVSLQLFTAMKYYPLFISKTIEAEIGTLSKSFEQHGFTIDPGSSAMSDSFINWRNENMTFTQATQLAQMLQHHSDQHHSTSKNTLTDQRFYSAADHTGLNTQQQLFLKRYIDKKLGRYSET